MSYAVDLQVRGTIKLVEEPTPIVVRVTSRIGGATITGVGNMAYNMPVETQVDLQVAYVDQAGNPAVVDGDVAWSSSNDAIAAVTSTGPDACNVKVAGTLGSAQVTASADADLGQGVRAILTLFDITVVAGEAVAGTISPVGTPTPIP